MQDLPVIYWIPKMHKNPISFRFIIASPVCSIKPISRDITTIFKLFYEKDIIQKENYGQDSRPFGLFWPYTKILPGKLLYILNLITDFAFKGCTGDYITVYNSGPFRLLSPRYKILFGVFIKQQFLPGTF